MSRMMGSQPPERGEGSQHDRYRETHPAYAMIGASRVSATPGVALFGSDFRHQGFVRIQIHAASLDRGVSHDWVHAGDLLAEVAISEAQWATFVSTLNVGNGVPATLAYSGDTGWVPDIEPVTDRREQYGAEIRERLERVIASAVAIRDAAPNKRSKEAAERLIQDLRSNLPWMAEMFDQHAEQTVEKAKIEVAAYIAGALQRAGLEALAGGQPIAMLGDGDES